MQCRSQYCYVDPISQNSSSGKKGSAIRSFSAMQRSRKHACFEAAGRISSPMYQGRRRRRDHYQPSVGLIPLEGVHGAEFVSIVGGTGTNRGEVYQIRLHSPKQNTI